MEARQLVEEGAALPDLYRAATEGLSELKDGGGTPPARQEKYKEAIGNLEACELLVDRAGLFSPNEEADDIATSDLRYLLVSFHLGMALQDLESGSRFHRLQAAALYLERFLKMSRSYGLLPEELRQLGKREDDDDGGAGGLPVREDAAARRARKIAMFKREKLLRHEEAGFLSRLQIRADEAVVELDADQEEDLRRLWTVRIQLSCLQAVEAASSLRMELSLLQHQARLDHPEGEAEREKLAQQQAEADKRHRDTVAAAMQARILGSGDGRREQMRRDVFKPTNLPTMSIEQYAEREMARAAEQQARWDSKDAEKAKKEEEGDEDDEEEVMKKRAWDDWKDENPRGSGNSATKPIR